MANGYAMLLFLYIFSQGIFFFLKEMAIRVANFYEPARAATKTPKKRAWRIRNKIQTWWQLRYHNSPLQKPPTLLLPLHRPPLHFKLVAYISLFSILSYSLSFSLPILTLFSSLFLFCLDRKK